MFGARSYRTGKGRKGADSLYRALGGLPPRLRDRLVLFLVGASGEEVAMDLISRPSVPFTSPATR